MTPENFIIDPHRLWTGRRGTARRLAEGFSLIEMIIVVAILGIVCAIAIPSFQRYAINGNLRTAARDIVSDFNALKGRAMAESREYLLTISGNQYSIQACADGIGPDGVWGTADDVITSPPCAVWMAPPAGVITPKNPSSFSADIVLSPNSSYVFQTRGTVIATPAGSIGLANSRGSTANITVNAAGRTSAQFTMK